MNTAEILAHLASHKPERGPNRRLSLSRDLVRCEALGLVAVGGDKTEDDQTNGLVDGLHWHRHVREGRGPLRLMLGRASFTQRVLQTLGTMMAVLGDKVVVHVELENEEVHLVRPDFAGAKSDWLNLLTRRDVAVKQPPDLVTQLRQRVQSSSFRWYRTLSEESWSGRVDGLRVCEVRDGQTHGVLRVGAVGKGGAESGVRARFKEILREHDAAHDELSFDSASTDLTARIIDAVARDRSGGVLAKCEREHLLEARILRSAVRVAIDDQILEAVEPLYPFQFPTLWSVDEGSDRRYLDVLMRVKEVPWAVELKVPEGGQGQYYRHAIKQAVLYREFIRSAKQLHPWFARRGLDASRCAAAVVLPLRGRGKDLNLREITWLANLFDVRVATIEEVG